MSSQIGVVIRTLNEGALLGRCLEALRAQRGGYELDTIVVDSGSTDDTLEIARRGGARILEIPPGEFDYSHALNVGIRAVSGDLIVTLSAHAIPVGNDFLELLAAPFEDVAVAGVGARQLPWPDAPWQEVYRLRDQFDERRRVYPGADADILFSNAASCIRRGVWNREPFTLPAVEDLEWARRVVGAGWKIVYEPRAAVYHSHYEDARARAQRLIDMNRVNSGAGRPRSARRTLREAIGLVFRGSRTVLGLDTSIGRKLLHLLDVIRMAWYYAVDFSRHGTTAERRREQNKAGAPTRTPR